MQLPETQRWVVPQTLPQAPQWASSALRSRQVPLQLVRPVAQAVPAEQAGLSRAPQATQVEPLALYPVLQVMPQAPLVQRAAPLAGVAQLRPHWPQWLVLLLRVTHCPLQRVWPLGQPHALALQTCPAGQALLHIAQ